MSKYYYPCTYEKACHVLWLVHVCGYSQTHAAIVVGLNVGTVCHVVHGRRFPHASPRPI
ncbi:hypothetical protein [Lichenifustis flavocetrariae]|uniref:Uncharacterized protein n=1 Tax=Lichenifustis flavocetrariae TaxID=2949735 RepID=A0AA41YYB1_9HYPH|nr:hypothetical protein [Lichenifustis flavocetrariae]MCW6507075.1 hypothetical protein [Lichenifustis flavocetrariae]